MKSATQRWLLRFEIKNKWGFIRSNLDLNAFPGMAWLVDSAIRKEFLVYEFRRGWNSEQRLHISAKKLTNFEKIEKLEK